MSINAKSNTVKVIACFAVGLVCGTITKAYLTPKEDKSGTLSFASKAPPLEMNKHTAPLKVEILQPERIPDNETDEVEIVGRIALNQNFTGNIQYLWDIPEGVKLVEGQREDSLSGLHAGQVAEVKIRVTGFNKSQQHAISLSSSGPVGDQRLGNSAIVVSRPEDTMESVAPVLVEEAAQQLGEAAGRRRK
ncbi:hypothetical protein [Bdellovibrio sp. HCB2-146]|uniref:hypothetical protein n=1 Tax=Bdellovibrio sp. HCB2-146 TaxID=3394362 RepID=UPI0039BCFB3C